MTFEKTRLYNAARLELLTPLLSAPQPPFSGVP